MKLSLFSDYALRILMYAALKGGPFRLEEATGAYGISRHHAAKVIHHLATLGYLRTRRGRGGGSELGRPAGEVRLGQLVRETEEEPIIVECFDPVTNTCPISSTCRLKGVLAEGVNAFYASLDRYTLEDLMANSSRNALGRILLKKLKGGSAR